MKKEQLKKLCDVAKVNKNLPIITDNACLKDGRLTSTNLEVQISMPTTWEGEGVINIKNIYKMGAVSHVNIEPETEVAVISIGNGKQKAPVMPLEDWPRFTDTPNSIGVIVASDIARLKKAVKFIGNDEIRPVMSGVNLSDRAIAATDAHWLYRDFITSELPEGFNIIIPKPVIELLNVGEIYTLSSAVQEYWGENKDKEKPILLYALSNGEEVIKFRAIEGLYPNYEVVIPQENPLTVLVDSKTLKQAIEQAIPSANQTAKGIEFYIRDGWMKIEATDPDEMREYSTVIPCTTTWKFPEPAPVIGGEEPLPLPEAPEVFCIKMKGDLLLEILKSNNQPTTVIHLSADNRAILIGNEYLLMPMMLEGEKMKHEGGFPLSQIPSETAMPVVRVQAVNTDFKPMKFNGLILTEYSERAFVVRGKTKDCKDKLRELKGRFNPYLEGGPGWVFPKVWFENVVSTLK